jgi:lipopolysaccharide transport system permease protein
MDTNMNEQKFTTVITPKTGWFDIDLKEIWAYRDLILLFVKRNFVAQYKQTILGPAWAFIQPFLTTIVFTLIFGNIAGLAPGGIPSFAFYFSGTIMWQYFSGCLSSTANTFVANARTMGKVYYPRLVMPISTVLSQLISFGIQFVFLVFFVLYFTFTKQGVHPNWWILMTPVLLLQLAMLSMGFGIIISSVTTKYRDLAKLVGFGVHLWMYGTPVAYDMFSMAAFAPGGKWHTLYMCNPVTSLINIFRLGYLGFGQVEWKFYGIGWITTLVVLFFGVILFSHVEKTFMDTV